MSKMTSLQDLASRIGDGQQLAIPCDFNGFYSGIAMEATRELIRRGVRGLDVVAYPTTGIQGDLLIGAGCVASIQASSVFTGEHGVPPRFRAAFADHSIKVLEATCPAIHAAFQAGEKGIPFIPLRGIIGSDILNLRPDWKVIDNPFGNDDPIVVLPAITPDWALFHAPMADRHGNVYIGRRHEMLTLAHAAKGTLVTFERLYEGNLTEDEGLAGGTIPDVYINAIALVPKGAWPHGFGSLYPEDAEHIEHYYSVASTREGFEQYMAEFVLNANEVVA